MDQNGHTDLPEDDSRDVLPRSREDSVAQLLGPDWVEVEPGIFMPPAEPPPAN